MIEIQTDGASRGNPGAGGSGAEIKIDGKLIYVVAPLLYTTNNEAEYIALLVALKLIASTVRNTTEHNLTVKSDSMLMIKQLRGEFRVKDKKLAAYHKKIGGWLQSYKSVNLIWHNRNLNAADKIANIAADIAEVINETNEAPLKGGYGGC